MYAEGLGKVTFSEKISMRKCEKCGFKFPNQIYDEEKIWHDLHNRKYCFKCSPFKGKDPKPQNRTCFYCNKKLTSRQEKFCSNKCQKEFDYDEYINKWLNHEVNGLSNNARISKHVRRYMLEKYDFKCQICGWSEKNPTSGKIPVEIHHLDGNYKNNRPENLQVLCPNHHSLTPTYGALNMGKGRKK